MMPLAIDPNFGGTGWRIRKTAGGLVTVAGGILTTEAAAGEQAFMDYYIPALPGQRVELEVWARLLSGEAVAWIDAVNHNSPGPVFSPGQCSLDSADWKRYRIAATMPHKATSPSYLRAILGIRTAPTGKAQFWGPTIRTGGGYGTPPVIARGCVRVLSGVASMHPDFPSHGIAAVERTAADTVTVTLDHELPTSPQNVRPVVHLTGTTDHPEVPLVGSIVAGAVPTFAIKWSKATTWADITTSNWFAHLQVTL